jgi:hypothetical protein
MDLARFNTQVNLETVDRLIGKAMEAIVAGQQVHALFLLEEARGWAAASIATDVKDQELSDRIGESAAGMVVVSVERVESALGRFRRV